MLIWTVFEKTLVNLASSQVAAPFIFSIREDEKPLYLLFIIIDLLMLFRY